MSTSGITSSMSSQFQQFQQEFKQLGQDLQSGNLSSAQSDFATIENTLEQPKFVYVAKQQPDCPGL